MEGTRQVKGPRAKGPHKQSGPYHCFQDCVEILQVTWYLPNCIHFYNHDHDDEIIIVKYEMGK
jgi:hypothetical protein